MYTRREYYKILFVESIKKPFNVLLTVSGALSIVGGIMQSRHPDVLIGNEAILWKLPVIIFIVILLFRFIDAPYCIYCDNAKKWNDTIERIVDKKNPEESRDRIIQNARSLRSQGMELFSSIKTVTTLGDMDNGVLDEIRRWFNQVVLFFQSAGLKREWERCYAFNKKLNDRVLNRDELEKEKNYIINTLYSVEQKLSI